MTDEPTKPTDRRLREALLQFSSQLERDEEYQASQRQYRQMQRLRLLTSVVMVVAATMLVAYQFRWYIQESFAVKLGDSVIPLTIIIISIGVFAIKYLESSPIEANRTLLDSEIHQLKFIVERQIRELRSQIQSPKPTADLSEADKKKVLQQLLAKFESEALNDYLVALKDSVAHQVRAQSLEDRYQLTRSRLAQETKDLAKRGNFNLVIGAFSALAGLVVLGYTVSYTPLSSDGMTLMSYYVPRTALVLLIEVFSYFFLSLYRASLTEIKYFQNELTNVESKHLAWELAQKTDNSQIKVTVIDQIARTERNLHSQQLRPEGETPDQYSSLSALTEAVKALAQRAEEGAKKGG